MQADHPEDHDAITRDHVKPRSKGGRDNVDNIVAACKGCNEARGSMDAIAFFCMVQNGFRLTKRKGWRRRRAIAAAQTRARVTKRFRVTEDRSIWVTA
jgi:5-methylcytosine-specific restriction endonuclease McrA